MVCDGMSSFNVGANDVTQHCHLLTPDRWSDPAYLALVKDFWARNMASRYGEARLNLVIDVLPDFKTLNNEILVILEINRGNLTPHLLVNRTPTPSIPDAMFITGDATTWCNPEKLNGIAMCPGYTNDPRGFDKQLVAHLIFMLVHAARRMADGVRGGSDGNNVVLPEQSQFFHSTLAVSYLISCNGNETGFRLPEPDVVKDLMSGTINDVGVDGMMSMVFGGQSIEQFFNSFLRDVKANGIFPLDFALNDLIRLSTSMAKLAAMSWYTGEKYSSARDLYFAKLIDPSLPAPYLTPRGKVLRDMIWKLGLRQLPLFAGIPSQPMGLGFRKPISEIVQISGSIKQK